MAILTRTSVMAVKKEVTEGTLIVPASGSDYTILREGFSIQGSVESLSTDELTGQREMSAPILGKETPTISIPKYLKGSGTEGAEPDYGIMIEASLGSVAIAAAEKVAAAGSSAGTASARGIINIETGAGAGMIEGQALLVKDLTNGYKIRNIHSISTDALSLNFNMNVAPAALVATGKAVHYYPSVGNPPTYSAHVYQGQSSSAFYNAISGLRTTGFNISLPAAGLAEITFDAQGSKFFFNPIVITASNNKIDFTDSSSTVVATLTNKAYKTPIELADEIASKMTGASADVISCSFSSSTGKFTISSDGTVLSLLWNTGTNTAASTGPVIGFPTSANSTTALTYAGAEVTYNSPYAPIFDAVDPIVIKNSELLIGDFFETSCRATIDASFAVSTARQDANSICAETGVSESLSLSLESTFTATLHLQKHEVAMFDRFINNKTTSLMFNCGVKDNVGNWVAGKCVNIYMKNAKISGDVIADNAGIAVMNIEAKGFGTGTEKSFHINFV
jgi:hypothetical protein